MLRLIFGFFASFGPWVLLTAFLFLVGAILAVLGLIFGFSFADVDLWLETHGGLFNAAGLLLFRIACGLVFLLCLFMLAAPILFRKERGAEPTPWGCLLLAIPLAWFAWTGMTAPL